MMELTCWHCGGSLKDVPRPIRSQMRCPHCRADLHVCRMCRSYDKRYIGHCSHDEADRVLDKESANYCTFYSPEPNAFGTERHDPAAQAKSELDALFGSEQSQAEVREPGAEASMTSKERALRDAESLFDLGRDKRRKDRG